MPYWDDLYLVNSGFGIFTSITGLAPHRTFNIEWRAQFFPGSGSANFEIQLHEDSPIITVIYGVNTAAGTSATVGVQSGTESFTQFSCNNPAGPIVSGLRIDFVPGGVGALHVLKKGTGTGTVTSPDPGINCGATCDAWFAEGTNKVLTATPATGSRFVGWTGCDKPSGATCTMSITSDKTVTATFNVSHTLTVKKSGAGSGSVASSPAGNQLRRSMLGAL